MKQRVFSRVSPLDRDVNNSHVPFSNPSEAEEFIHDLRQPLSVIESVAYYLELVSSDDKACAHARQIQAMVQQAHRILSRAEQRQEEPATVLQGPRILARQDAS